MILKNFAKMAEIDIEAIFEKWTIDEDAPDDESNDKDTITFESLSKKYLGVSKQQEFEIKVAVKLLSNNSETLSSDQFDDLFLTLGYTLHDSDIEKIISQCEPDANGRFAADTIISSFSKFKQKQLDIHDLAIVFNTLVEKRRLGPRFDPHMEGDPIKRKSKVPPSTIQTVLSEVLANDQSQKKASRTRSDQTLSQPPIWVEGGEGEGATATGLGGRREEAEALRRDVEGVVGEVSSCEEQTIDFRDFVRVFRS